MPATHLPPAQATAQPGTLLAGATGLIGRELLAQLAGGAPLLLLTRRAPPAEWAAMGTVLQVGALSAPGPLPPLAQAYLALGTTMGQAGSEQAFRAVDLDAVVAVARAAQVAGVTHLAVVSALGADPNARVFYNRVKGEMESALIALGFTRLVIARPSLLAGTRETLGQARRPGEVWTLRLTRPLNRWIPARWRPIAPEVVARAMIRALNARQGPGVQVIESDELQQLGA
jgi:uncharacterized protein YbjT (DUF2867 family)